MATQTLDLICFGRRSSRHVCQSDALYSSCLDSAIITSRLYVAMLSTFHRVVDSPDVHDCFAHFGIVTLLYIVHAMVMLRGLLRMAIM